MVNPREQILRLTGKRGVLRARDLALLDIPRRHLTEMVESGDLHKSGRGLYVLASADITEHHSLAEASARIPDGIVCLLSAMRFHGLTLQNPHEIWMAIPPAARTPAASYPPLRIFRFSGPARKEGVEHHRIEGVDVKIYGVAKTVADGFKFRNKIGTDVAIEALRTAWRRKKLTADQIWHFAKVCRVSNIMRPYMDTLE